MRIEPKILDGNIERKSLYEKKQRQQENPVVESYDALFMDPEQIIAEEKLSKLEVIDNENRQAVFDAYRKSGLSIDDIDVIETHDCFTSSEYVAISAFGITEPGKEYEAVEKGVISFDGSKPINPSGGLIGCGHPVGASGARMFLDLYKQVTQQAGGYQVCKNGKYPKNAMMLNIGGSATTNYVFIIGKE